LFEARPIDRQVLRARVTRRRGRCEAYATDDEDTPQPNHFEPLRATDMPFSGSSDEREGRGSHLRV
jgi:hypothetical protein